MKLEEKYSTGARRSEYGIGAMKISMNQRHNNKSREVEGPFQILTTYVLSNSKYCENGPTGRGGEGNILAQ